MIYDLNTKEEQKGVICGMLLGDGGLHQPNNLYIAHSIKQEEYILFKRDILEIITNKSVHTRYLKVSGFPEIRIYPHICETVKEVFHIIAPEKKKRITPELLELLTIQGIAIWYMDDGSCTNALHKDGSYGGAGITLNTYLSELENKYIVEYFRNKYDINWYINKSKGKQRLVMRTKEGKKFMNLIKDYVIDSMKYKTYIGKQYAI